MGDTAVIDQFEGIPETVQGIVPLIRKGYVVLGDQVVVKPDEDEKVVERIKGAAKIQAGIWVPDDAEELFDEAVTGWVVGVGPGLILTEGENAGGFIRLPVEVGDHIYHSKYGVTEIEIDGETYFKMDRKALFMKMPIAAEEP